MERKLISVYSKNSIQVKLPIWRHLASTLAGRLAPTPMWGTLHIYLDVGRNDSVSPGVQAFAAALEAHDLKPAFHLYPGEHNRPYWRAHTAEYLAFYAAGW